MHVLSRPASAAPRPVDVAVACQSWPDDTAGEESVTVRCFAPGGQPIQCCGHGLLTAAFIWQQRLGRKELPLIMGESRILSWCDDTGTWLRFARITTHPCAVPDWALTLFPGACAPIAAATCGDEQGYLVLQWSDDQDLEVLPLPGTKLGEHTGRALVCTAAQPRLGPHAIQLRYFAPQYGVAEDAATGSAMRVLADYWSPRFSQLLATQRSPRGGRLLSRWAQSYVDVGGHCQMLADTAGIH